MKSILFVLALFSSSLAFGQTNQANLSQPDPAKKILKVKASCGQCMFGMKANGCDLAVKIDGKTYFVEGTHINDYGDAHAEDGFCNAVRKAEVQGEVVNDKFKVTYFKLQPSKKEEKSKGGN